MRYLVIILLAGITCRVMSQSVVPQEIPCLQITQTNLPGLGSGIEATDCIETDGNVTFLQYENYSIHAGDYISFGQNTVIDPDASHQFHAYIDNGGMDLAWYFPNATPGTVEQYAKLELGVRFEADIETYVQNFNNELPGIQINPFDPEQLDLKAEFWYYSTILNEWVGPQQVFGFYYEEYTRNSAGTYPDGQWILDNTNQHRFRIRFAPRYIGLWKCKVSADVPGYGSFQSTEFTFECVSSSSGNPGFMRVGDNKRYFRRGEEAFFPVGHNLTWPRNTAYGWSAGFHPITPAPVFESYHEQLEILKDNGANYFRFINQPWATDIEFEKLGDYSDRMRHAWEMDEIVRKAESMDILIHWNLDLGCAFNDRGLVSSWWDWTKAGDPNEGLPGCALPTGVDPGYCYHSQIPECVHPVDFLASETARKHYKNKLRYLVARYAYSTSIGMIELFSEVNGFGKEFLMENDGTGCVNTQISEPYSDNPDVVCPLVLEWQGIMTDYIQSMNVYDHPVVVSYAGLPDLLHGDISFALPSVDVMSWNFYSMEVARFSTDYQKTEILQSELGIDKPLIHSEYGALGTSGYCDNGAQFQKILAISPFYGAACSMNWDWQYPGETELWPQIGVMRGFLEGIKLDEENWQAGVPQVTPDKAVEMYYLRNFEADNYRACGVISNRTFNFYTQSTSGTECNLLTDELEANFIYQEEASYTSTVDGQIMGIPFMGENVDYKINWYNALTGDLVDSGEYNTGLLGFLELHFPLLTGNATQPLLFFEIYRSNQPSFKSAEEMTEMNAMEFPSLDRDSTTTNIVLTNWESDSGQGIILVFPNPTSDQLQIKLLDSELLGITWTLTNSIGEIILTGNMVESAFQVNLSAYSDGVYIFRFAIGNTMHEFKIVKS